MASTVGGDLRVLLPVRGHDKFVVVVLDALVPVVFGFEEIEGHCDIPAFDIAIVVERQAAVSTNTWK